MSRKRARWCWIDYLFQIRLFCLLINSYINPSGVTAEKWSLFSRFIIHSYALMHCTVHSNNTIKRISMSSSNPYPLCRTAPSSLRKRRIEGLLLSPFIQKMATPHCWKRNLKKNCSQTCILKLLRFYSFLFHNNFTQKYLI